MKSFIQFSEDLGSNVGSIAGSGDARLPPDQREPGLTPDAKNTYKKKNKKGADELTATIAMMVARNVPA